jgi:serine/threonine protein kinase
MLERGHRVAGYEIEGVLGRGGMGVVYEARQLSLGRTVALKILAGQLTADASFQQRFRREGQLQAAIEHPNIVPIYEAGELEDSLFIAMRLIKGPNLKEMIVARELDAERTLRLLERIADALDAAHEAGLIHRDIKPQNILVGPRDHPYLADFGLTKGAGDAGLTQTGQFVGTIDYLAPEQIRGEEPSAQTDIYALTAVLFECLTGGAVFPKPSEAAAMWAHISEPPPLVTDSRPDLPAALDAVVARGLAKEPQDRPVTARELIADAKRALARSTVAPPPQPLERAPEEPRAGATRAAAPVPAPFAPAPPPPAPAPAPPPQPTWTAPRTATRALRRPHAQPVESFLASRHEPIRVALDRAFQYTNEPLEHDNVIPHLAHDELVEKLLRRVTHSKGGSLLVTGFRGVGKSTVVHRALATLKERGGAEGVIPVRLNAARPMSGSDLLYAIVRRLHDELEDSGALERLDESTRARIELAYDRTSRSRKEMRSSGVERNRGLSLSVPGLTSVAPSLSRKDLQSAGSEDVLHDYEDADVEHDLTRIVERLRRGSRRADGPGRFVRAFGRRNAPDAWKGHVIVVIDELDKLTAHPGGKESIAELLASLKNLLTLPGAHFVFVGGPDLHEEAAEDRRRGNSVYESVFSWECYVPCVWGAEQELLDALIADEEAARSPQVENLRGHLAFWGRGVPRRMLRELDSFIAWEGDRPFLVLEGDALDRVSLYAALNRIVEEFVTAHEGAAAQHLGIDQWRIGVHYAVEWILSFAVSFTVEDVVRLSADARIDPLLALDEHEVHDLLEHLESHHLVRQVSGLANQTFYGDIPEAQVLAYAVADDVAAVLHGFGHEAEVAALADDAAAGAVVAAAAFAGALGQHLDGGRYEVLAELDRAGAGRVYRAVDTRSGAEVAVKVFDLSESAGYELMRARFLREGAIALTLRHPHIVETYDTFGEDDGTLGIVMRLVDGVSLAERLRAGALEVAHAVGVAGALLQALDYLAGMGVVRVDLKPSGIVVDERLSPTIVNLGLAKHADGGDAATVAGARLGTPTYAAPEQLAGEPVDIRTDLYSLALIVYEMLAGRPAREGESIGTVVRAAFAEPADLSVLPVSQPFRDVLARALARDPDERFASPRDMLAALQATPEGGGLGAAA